MRNFFGANKGYEKKVKGCENFNGKFKGCENFHRKFKGCENFRRKIKGMKNFHHFPKNTPTGYPDLKKTGPLSPILR